MLNVGFFGICIPNVAELNWWMKCRQGVLSPQVSPGGHFALALWCGVLVPAPHTAVSDGGNPLNHCQELEPGFAWMFPNGNVSQLESDLTSKEAAWGHWHEGWRGAGR